jgi:WD40 repeat protein/transcriptional regulator with XRE-family HTH domain
VDPEAGAVQEFAVELRRLRRGAGNPGYRELARKAHYSATTLAQAARGDRLPTLAVALAYVTACGGDRGEWEARWRDVAARSEPGGPDEDGSGLLGGRAPYVGLASYEARDSDRFFGRERLVEDLVARVAGRRLLAVFGPSGSGKSSLLRAGLLPALKEAGAWQAVLLTPGRHPLEECAIRLASRLGLPAGPVLADLTGDPRNLGLLVRQALAEADPGVQLVLMVDQFEEVFTLCADEHERTLFLDALVAAVSQEGSRTRLVLGVRADFYPRCAEHPGLVAALRDAAQVLVGPMTQEELTRAITQPAVRAGLMVDRALVATVLSETAGQPGALPFVSHALWETWRARRGNALPLAAYQAAGGVRGAISQSAQRLYESFDESQRRTARAVLLRLTALGEGTEDTRRRVARAELGDDPPTATVLDALTRARLLTLAENTVEIAHEALIAGWPTLRDWLAEDRELLRAQRRLTETVTEWDRYGRADEFLYRGAVLAAWRDRSWDELNTVERTFLTASRDRQDRERISRRRRVRLTLAGLGAAVVVMSLLAVLALVQSTRRAEERDLALSRQLAADARGQLAMDPELGLLLAIEAFHVRPTAEAEAVLRQAVVDSRLRASRPTGHGRALGVAFSPDGRLLATTGVDGAVRIWRRDGEGLAAGEPVVLRGHEGHSWSPVFSPDGRYLATGGEDGTIRVWDLTGHREPMVLPGHGGEVQNVAFSPDGLRVAGSGTEGIRLWDLDTGREPVVLRGHSGATKGIAFTPDGRRLASCGADATLRIWDPDARRELSVQHGERGYLGRLAFSRDGQHLMSIGDKGVQEWDPAGSRPPSVTHGHEGVVLSLVFGPDGHTMASSGSEGTIRIWNAGSDTNPTVLRGHRGGEVWSVAFSPDGRQLASVGNDGTLRLWDAILPGDPVVLGERTGPTWAAALSPDGRSVASGGDDGRVRLWHDGAGPTVLSGHTKEVLAVGFSPDGRRVASGSRDGSVRLWDVSGATEPKVLTGHDGSVWAVAFSPDGRRVASGGSDGTIRVWSAGTDPVVLRGHRDQVRQLAFTPDGRQLASAGRDGTVRIWDAAGMGEPVVLTGHEGPLWSVALSPDGRRVASGGTDGTIRVWNTGGDTNPVVLRGHQGSVWGVAFSPDGRWLASSGIDGTVRLWKPAGDGSPTVFRGQRASVESITFSPDGQHLLTAHDDGTARLWRCTVCRPAGEVLALARTRVTRGLSPDERALFGI